jgi:hypothetical protein
MAREFGTERTVDMLVNCKTYPAISKKYTETVCTGGIERSGKFIRLYPVPFRLLSEEQQYGRWDVIRVQVYRDTKDSRPESAHIEPNRPINIIEKIGSEKARWEWMRNGVFDSVGEMESRKLTNGMVEIEPEELYWEPESKTWSAGQLEVLTQGNLFHDQSLMDSLAQRVPWQFKLRFMEKNTARKFDQKVLAWSYYRGFQRHINDGMNEQEALAKVRDDVHKSILNSARCVYAILGTHSRFGHWMVSGIYHLPRQIRDDGILKLFTYQ